MDKELYNFKVKECKEIAEIDGRAWIMQHKSGAKLLWLDCEDTEKAFAISFCTPPQDDSGVFHILEHSVLCGSKKFPVKEPFVNLLKSSMQTFLNAMTYPDKTVYPVASTNEKDLLNLMDVYLDAVFHPNIYQKQEIFKQEGWHYELNQAQTTPAQEKTETLQVNGVVFNEMKGVLSEPENVLFNGMQSALYPDTCYSFESGGAPEKIPNLSYEQFLDEHRRHYRIDNSQTCLYGNLNIENVLEWLDKNYFTPIFNEQKAADSQRKSENLEALRPRTIQMQKPVKNLNHVVHMNTSVDNACLGLGFCIGHAKDINRINAVNVLSDALFGSNESPLKAALLEEGFATQIEGGVMTPMLQPFFSVTARGLQKDANKKFLPALQKHTKKLLENGIDKKIIEAVLDHLEFSLKEADYGIASGVALALSCFAGWLYDENCACEQLMYEKHLVFLRENLKSNYYEDLLKELILDNDHCCFVELCPDDKQNDNSDAQDTTNNDEHPATNNNGKHHTVVSDDEHPATDNNDEHPSTKDDLGARLAKKLANMNEQDKQGVRQEVDELRKAQACPDSPENLAKLPHLKLTDISKMQKDPSWHFSDKEDIACIYHDLNTKGIVYTSRYFDLKKLEFEELPLVQVLKLTLGRLSTSKHSAKELDRLLQSEFGNFSSVTTIVQKDCSLDDFEVFFKINAHCLEAKLPSCNELVHEICTETKFDDKQRISRILQQTKIFMEQGFINNGHSYAKERARSYFAPAALLAEKINGIDFYLWLCDLLKNFDEHFDNLSAQLTALTEKLFCDDTCTISFAGTENAKEIFWKTNKSFGTKSAGEHLVIPACIQKNEAFITKSNVCFASLASDSHLFDGDGDGDGGAGSAKDSADLEGSGAKSGGAGAEKSGDDAKDGVGESGVKNAGAESGAKEFSGAWLVANTALSLDYLWNEVRVKGGAYGVGFAARRLGGMSWYTYRDPHLNSSIERISKSATWLKNFNTDKSSFEGLIVSAVSSIDAPIKARALIARQDNMYFRGEDETIRERLRQGTLEASIEDVRACSSQIQQAIDKNCLCVIGNEKILKANKLGLNLIELC